MAHPWVFEEHFEAGTAGNFDSETDANSVLDFPSHKTLVGRSRDPMPFRGAYVMRVGLEGADTAQYVQEDAGFDIALNGTLYIRFYLFISTDLTMAASDLFQVLVLQSTGPVPEAVVYITNDGGTIEIGVNETASTVGASEAAFTLGQWHSVELFVNLDDGGSDDGTLDLWLDGNAVGSQITGLDQAAVIQARFGVSGLDAGTTAGCVCFDQIVADDARIYPLSRFESPRIVTISQHLFLGPGWVDLVDVQTTNSDNVIRLFDTDEADANIINANARMKLELDPDSSISSTHPIYFEHGCYVQLTGTDPRVLIGWVDHSDTRGVFGPLTVSEGSLRNWARSR